jgi:hypothetical protein
MRIKHLILASAPFLLAACNGGTPDDGGAGKGGTTGGGMGGQPPSGGAGTGPVTITGGASGTPSAGGSSAGTGGSLTPAGGSSGTSAGATSGGSSAAGASAGTTSGGAGAGGASGGTTAGGSGAAGASAGTAGGGGGGAGGGAGAGGAPVSSICPYTPPEDPSTFPDGWTSADVTVFNENGGWTWYNDERVVVDVEAGKIVVSSAASSASSQTSNTSVDAVIHDLATGQNTKTSLGTLSYSDDHNNGGIVVKAPGEYFVAWAHHNVDCNTYYRNYANGAWSDRVTFTWGSHGCPWDGSDITYNNVWKMSAQNRYYNFVRSVETSPGILVSEDNGATWAFRGRLTASPQQGYNAGYYKYWGNGVDRIDFFATEAHPRDADTSVYHGYIQGTKSYDSLGVEQDDNILDTNAPGITEFTRVFAARSPLNGVTLNALWNFDVARYDDGTIGVLWQGREGNRGKENTNPNHRLAYSRFDGTEWKSTYLVRGGRTLYRNMSDWWEEDYLGGAALDPDDPHVIYVSTPIDPRDDMTNVGNHEIWKGVTCDDGATFQWTPMTMNSQNENLRPVVPKWSPGNTALLWFRGNYQTAQMYSAQVVGIITQEE